MVSPQYFVRCPVRASRLYPGSSFFGDRVSKILGAIRKAAGNDICGNTKLLAFGRICSIGNISLYTRTNVHNHNNNIWCCRPFWGSPNTNAWPVTSGLHVSQASAPLDQIWGSAAIYWLIVMVCILRNQLSSSPNNLQEFEIIYPTVSTNKLRSPTHRAPAIDHRISLLSLPNQQLFAEPTLQ